MEGESHGILLLKNIYINIRVVDKALMDYVLLPRRKLRVNVGKSKVMRCFRYGNGDECV